MCLHFLLKPSVPLQIFSSCCFILLALRGFNLEIYSACQTKNQVNNSKELSINV